MFIFAVLDVSPEPTQTKPALPEPLSSPVRVSHPLNLLTGITDISMWTDVSKRHSLTPC